MDDPSLIQEQIRYYRARAAEYDATSMPPDNPFGADMAAIHAWLRGLAPLGRTLELAAGTGQWTGLLAELADELTATDAAPEMLELNAAKTADTRVTYRVVDAFALEPRAEWDTVFFGFWLSHVPLARFDDFWGLVGGLLRPGGRAILVDEADHGLWDEDWADRERQVVHRPLQDGTVYRAVKVLWNPDELGQRLRSAGWSVEIGRSGPFYRGVAAESPT
jgi:demethylmenaquinone methyltransferase/2-methoxy-6-polyprenyl-1,4-benzoquinol methylase